MILCHVTYCFRRSLGEGFRGRERGSLAGPTRATDGFFVRVFRPMGWPGKFSTRKIFNPHQREFRIQGDSG